MGWKEYKIKDVAVNIFSGGTPSTKNSGYYNGNIPWLNTKEINFRKINGTLSSISESGLLNSAAKWVPENSVIVAMYGVTAGKVAINAIPLTTNQACCNIVVNNDKFDFKFIYYSLYNSYLELKNLSSGAAQQNLNVNIISNFTISIPDLVEQRAIATVLSNLDGKIDLLRRQNATLEAMAEALFKQLFVNEVKEEWKTGTLGDICACITEKFDPGSANYSIKYIGLEHIDKKIIYLSRFGESTEINSAKFKFYSGDILFGKLRPYFHKVCFAPFDGVCSTDILVIRPKKENMFLFSLFAFYQCEVVDFATYCSNGTRMPRIDWNTLKTFELSLPDKESIYKFNQMCAPWIDKIRYNQTQIRTLENLRDTLLPKLMSGELRVSLD